VIFTGVHDGAQEVAQESSRVELAPGEARSAPVGRAAYETETPGLVLYPADLFTANPAAIPFFWTCVRTRPRWEKKFAAFLHGQSLPYFLPQYRTETFSGRKRRISWQPLFPGYVFVQGEQTKSTLKAAAMVVRLLQPRGAHQVEQLHGELKAIWCSLAQGVSLVPSNLPAVGEMCEIMAGPLRGMRGVYERPGKQGRLVLIVEMLSMGAAVEVPGGQVEPVRA